VTVIFCKEEDAVKIFFAILFGLLCIAGFGQAGDIKNFKFADGACYYVEPGKTELPVVRDGYWGDAQVRWDADPKSKYVHVSVNGIEKTVPLAVAVPDRQARQCLLIKKTGGILKAFALTDATPEQIREAIAKKKAYAYGDNTRKVQDGESPCKNCKATGKTESRKTARGKDAAAVAVICRINCPECNGIGKVPNFIAVPEIKTYDVKIK
jgi:hypothetical protein